MLAKSLGIALAAALAFSASSASAAVKYITVNGVFDNGAYDLANLFGVNGPLAGHDVRVTYAFDRSLGHEVAIGGFYDYVIGGSSLGRPSPILSAKVTINGVTVDYGADRYGEVSDFYNQGMFHVQSSATPTPPTPPTFSDTTSFSISDSHLPHSLNGDFGWGGDCVGCGSAFKVTRKFGLNLNEGGFYDVRSVRVSDSIPEPGAWALLIAGFGAAGAQLRRRRALLRTVAG